MLSLSDREKIKMETEMNEKFIFTQVKIKAELKDIWEAWTTEKGIKCFLAPDCKIELYPDGMYEIYFDPKAPYGKRGGEGLRILAIQPMKMFSFTWNAPPNLPEVRDHRTYVVIRLIPEKEGIRVTLLHNGWGTGGQWDEAFSYFQRAWGKIVLPRLKYSLENGPIDWSNPPNLDPVSTV